MTEGGTGVPRGPIVPAAVHSPAMERVRAIGRREPSARPPIQVVPGQDVTVGERDDEGGWLWCRSASGREGWAPARAVEPYVL